MTIIINEIEKEIFKEIVNIGLAKAADAFALIANEKVLISAPDLQIVEIENISTKVLSYESFTKVIESDLKGALGGKTYLLFSDIQSEKLINICLGPLKDNTPVDEQLKTSLLLEVGNIITGSLVTQLSNILKVGLFGSVPSMKNSNIQSLLQDLEKYTPGYKPFFFTVKTEFVYSWKSLEFPFLLVFNNEDFNKVIAIIKDINKKDGGLFKL